MSARRGNIARLNYDTREVINRMLRDGCTVKDINDWLIKKQIPNAPFNAQNFTNWRKGGYQEWLEEEKRLDSVRENAERIKRTVAAGGLEVYDELAWQSANAMQNVLAGADEQTSTMVAGTVARLLKAQTERLRAEMAKEQLSLAKEKHALDREKFEIQACTLFLKWLKEQRAKEIADSNLTNEEKIKQLRAEYFADVDALEASGQVVLPT